MSNNTQLFLNETSEHLSRINKIILNINDNIHNIEILNNFFRNIHTIKGNALSQGFVNLNRVAHKLEEILNKIIKNKIEPDNNIINLIVETVDIITDIFNCIKDNSNDDFPLSDIVERIDSILAATEGKLVNVTFENFNININDINKFKLTGDESIFKLNIKIKKEVIIPPISMFSILEFFKNNSLLLKTFPQEEDLMNEDIPDSNFSRDFYLIIIQKNDIETFISELKKIFESDIESVAYYKLDIKAILETQKKTAVKIETPTEDFVRVSITNLNNLLALVHNFVIIKNRFELRLSNTDDYVLKETLSQLRLNTFNLNNIVMDIRLLEINTVLNRFPSLVRKLAKDLGKKIKLIITGGETMLDRTIIDVIGDALIHIIRNSVDHGIETVEQRIAKGKSEEGTITISVKKIENQVELIIADDGNGIDSEKVKNKAIEKNLITKETAQKMSEDEIVELIMVPGFSTAEKVSDISGRGVGMDVVKDTIEKLRGHINIETKLNKGSKFIIEIPSALTITNCILFSICDEKYLIQTQSIYEIIEIKRDSLLYENGKYKIDLTNENILNNEFRKKIDVKFLNDAAISENNLYLLLIENDENYAGLAVEKIITQLEVIIKPLNRYFFKDIDLFNGAALLGDNTPALVLDPNYFFEN